MRDIICELIEIYIDISIKGYTDYCCELGMYQYGGCIASEVEYGSSWRWLKLHKNNVNNCLVFLFLFVFILNVLKTNYNFNSKYGAKILQKV